jgi:hypothetical protein
MLERDGGDLQIVGVIESETWGELRHHRLQPRGVSTSTYYAGPHAGHHRLQPRGVSTFHLSDGSAKLLSSALRLGAACSLEQGGHPRSKLNLHAAEAGGIRREAACHRLKLNVHTAEAGSVSSQQSLAVLPFECTRVLEKDHSKDSRSSN